MVAGFSLYRYDFYRLRSGEGGVFTDLCHSVHRGGVYPSMHLGRVCLPRETGGCLGGLHKRGCLPGRSAQEGGGCA